MGLLNKIKTALFEEEVVDVPLEEMPKEPVKEEKKVLERKPSVYESEQNVSAPVITDRELFKSEKTFDFPIFDDEEFEGMKAKRPSSYFEDEPNENMSINLFDYENPKLKKDKPKPKAEEIRGRAYESKKEDLSSRKFQPSPVISPVYGVLDKNYKKEDIVVKQEEKKQIDVDDVRKKAFGTLDDMEKTFQVKPKIEKPRKFEAKEKSIDELLEETAFDTISLKNFKEETKSVGFEEELQSKLKSEIPKKNENMELERLDKVKEKTISEASLDDETLESDLFDLIDSMYENKEEE